MRLKTVCLILLCLMILLGCTGKPPEIIREFHQINLIENQELNRIFYSLCLFIQPSDPDGFEDLEEIYLISDKHELFWKIDSESWSRTGTEDDIWIGSNSIRMPDGSYLPDGEYRVLLKDIGGETAEETIFLTAKPHNTLKKFIPKVSVAKNEITVSGTAESYTVWIYGKNGKYLRSVQTDGDRITVQKLIQQDKSLKNGFTIRIYSLLPDENIGIQSGPYYIQP